MNRPSINSLRSLFILAALAMIGFGLTGLVSQARADGPVTLTFDHSQVGLGAVLSDRVVLPADSKFPSPQLPTPQRTDIQLNGTQIGKKISFPASSNTGIQFPYMNFKNPINPEQKVPFTYRLTGDGLNGTFDAATGETRLAGKLDIIIVVGAGANPLDSPGDAGVPPLGIFGRCAIRGVPVDFSTETGSPFTAARYTDGLNGNGSMTTKWDNLPTAVPENATEQEKSDCGTLDTILHTPGAIWLSTGIVSPPPQPVPQPTCQTDILLCPPPQFTAIANVTLKPHRKKVRAGKRFRLTARIFNTGNIAARHVKLRIRTNRKKIRVRRMKKVNVPAHSKKKVHFRARVKLRARGGAATRVASHGWSGTTAVKILARKKHNKRHHGKK